MGKASEGQARSLIASFAVDTPWNKIGISLQPLIELTPKERGEKFAEFLQGEARRLAQSTAFVITREVRARFHPNNFLRTDWGRSVGSWSVDEKNSSLYSGLLGRLDMREVRLVTVEDPHRTRLHGEERRKRLMESGNTLLDLGHFYMLWVFQEYIPKVWEEKLEHLNRRVIISFDGTTLEDRFGNKAVMTMTMHHGKWEYYPMDFNDEFFPHVKSAVLPPETEG